jgi:uncharacterized paraquat-inducible protein A
MTRPTFPPSDRLACPACHSTISVPADSDRDQVECPACDAKLIARQTIGGIAVDIAEGGAL